MVLGTKAYWAAVMLAVREGAKPPRGDQGREGAAMLSVASGITARVCEGHVVGQVVVGCSPLASSPTPRPEGDYSFDSGLQFM